MMHGSIYIRLKKTQPDLLLLRTPSTLTVVYSFSVILQCNNYCKTCRIPYCEYNCSVYCLILKFMSWWPDDELCRPKHVVRNKENNKCGCVLGVYDGLLWKSYKHNEMSSLKKSTFHHFPLCWAAQEIKKLCVYIAPQPCCNAPLLFKYIVNLD